MAGSAVHAVKNTPAITIHSFLLANLKTGSSRFILEIRMNLPIVDDYAWIVQNV